MSNFGLKLFMLSQIVGQRRDSKECTEREGCLTSAKQSQPTQGRIPCIFFQYTIQLACVFLCSGLSH